MKALLALFCVCAVIAGAQGSAGDAADRLPTFRTEGSHYAYAKMIGAQFADRIKGYLQNDTEFNTVMLPYYNTQEGRQVYAQFLHTATTRYPEYVQELQGVADGAGVPFWQIFLNNLRVEVELLLWPSNATVKQYDTSCSDIHVSTSTHLLYGHNEDAATSVLNTAYLITATVHKNRGEKGEETYRYTAYNYPGYLAGNAWGFNEHGVSFSCNAVFPSKVNMYGVPRNFLTRDLYESKNIEHAIKKITSQPLASGFSLNLGSLKEKRIVNVEVAPEGHHVHEVKGNFSHFNMYKKLRIEQHDDPSTDHRQARADEMAAPLKATDVQAILGDTKDTRYPIFRTGQDGAATVSSALFDLRTASVRVWLNNPRDNKPAFYMTL